ncbi:MAG: hypothetical protein PHX84_01255 [Candidatus Shapirobacteria bacterium]|nr:hypothetical protein [Candidatus Shapirobacteria bacterium]
MKNIKTIIFWFVVISVTLWFWKNRKTETPTLIDQPKSEQNIQENEKCISTDFRECGEFPWLDLPLKHFSVKDVEWGSVGGTGKEGTMDEYTQVALDSNAVYQSYPTTTITIKQYSADIVPLTTKTWMDVRKKIQETENNNLWLEEVDKNYKNYGQMAVHFLDDFQDIEMFDSFDVDGDGVKEKILGLNFVGRANRGSYNAAIVKDNKVIFFVEEDESFIVPADTSNGFYVKWRSPDDNSARCCPRGYIKTRFVFDNGKFVPLYEQDVRYVVVGK